VARGEGEREEAWPGEEPPLLHWCRAVRGSRSNAGAGREGEEGRGEDGERAATGDWQGVKEDSMVMDGKEEEEEAGVVKESTGAPGLEPTLESFDADPEPEPKPAWTLNADGLRRSESGD